MDLPKDVVDYLLPKDTVKPEIEVGNYRLDWNEVSFGIKHHEVSKLKIFLRDVTPMLENMINMVKVLQKEAQRKKGLTKHQQGEAYTPQVYFVHDNFRILVSWDEQIFIDRVEDIDQTRDTRVVNSKLVKEKYSTLLNLEWNLGQLVPTT